MTKDLPLCLTSIPPERVEISNEAILIDDVIDGVRYELRNTHQLADVTADTLNAAYLSQLIYSLNQRPERPSTFRTWCQRIASEIVESKKVIDENVDMIIGAYEKARRKFDEPVIMFLDERGYLGRVSMDQMREAGIVPSDHRGIAVLGLPLEEAIEILTRREPNEDLVARVKASVADPHSFPLMLYRHGLSIAPIWFVQK